MQSYTHSDATATQVPSPLPSALIDGPPLPLPPSGVSGDFVSEAPSSALLDTLETSVGLGGEIAEKDGEKGKTAFHALQERKAKSRTIAARMDALGFPAQAHKVRQCSAKIVRRDFKCGCSVHSRKHEHNGKRGVYFRCKNRFCPVCSHQRSVDYGRHLGPALKRYAEAHGLHVSFLTLTFANSERLPELKAMKARVKRLLSRKRLWEGVGYHGALIAFEANEGNGAGKRGGYWHPHFHLLLFTERPIPTIERGEHLHEWQNSFNQRVASEWLAITGDSFIVKGKSFEWESGMVELVKYVTKDAATLPDRMLAEMLGWAKGKRFLSLNGKLYDNAELKALLSELEGEGAEERGLPEACPTHGALPLQDVLLGWGYRQRCYMVECVMEFQDGDLPPPTEGP